MSENVWSKCGKTYTLLADGVVGNITGAWCPKDSPNCSVQAVVTGTGVVAATITVQVSNDGINAVKTPVGTITLSGTTTDSDGFITTGASWKYMRAVVSGASGTISSITCIAGV